MAFTPNQVMGFNAQDMPASLTQHNYFGQTQVMEPALIMTQMSPRNLTAKKMSAVNLHHTKQVTNSAQQPRSKQIFK